MMQLDTVADVSVISENIAHKIPDIQSDGTDDIMLTDYNGNIIPVVGSTKVTVRCEEQVAKNLGVTVVKSNTEPLFGIEWLDHFCLNWENIFQISNVKAKITTQVLSQFDSILTENIWYCEKC